MNSPHKFGSAVGAHPLASAALVLVASVLFASCAVVGGIFKAGMVVGVIIIVLVVAIVFWIMSKFRSKP